MASFKKTVSINGAFKLLAVEDGTFINLLKILTKITSKF